VYAPQQGSTCTRLFFLLPKIFAAKFEFNIHFLPHMAARNEDGSPAPASVERPNPSVQSIMRFSESGLGSLASRIAEEFAASGRRAQTVSPGGRDELASSARGGVSFPFPLGVSYDPALTTAGKGSVR
jgi:hypothetical protein